jgi:hypothetical protein
VFILVGIIRSVRDGLRGVIDRDWVHSNLRSVRDGLRDFIIVLRCFIRFRSDRDGLRVSYWFVSWGWTYECGNSCMCALVYMNPLVGECLCVYRAFSVGCVCLVCVYSLAPVIYIYTCILW